MSRSIEQSLGLLVKISVPSMVQKLRNLGNICANFLVLWNSICTNFNESDVKCWRTLSIAIAYCFKAHFHSKSLVAVVQNTENVWANFWQKHQFGQFCSCKILEGTLVKMFLCSLTLQLKKDKLKILLHASTKINKMH